MSPPMKYRNAPVLDKKSEAHIVFVDTGHRIHLAQDNASRSDAGDRHVRIKRDGLAADEMSRILTEQSLILFVRILIELRRRQKILVSTIVRRTDGGGGVDKAGHSAKVILVVVGIDKEIDNGNPGLLDDVLDPCTVAGLPAIDEQALAARRYEKRCSSLLDVDVVHAKCLANRRYIQNTQDDAESKEYAPGHPCVRAVHTSHGRPFLGVFGS